MSYNTYWSGSLEITPRLKPKDEKKLRNWLDLDDSRIITDDGVLEYLAMEEWYPYYTPWAPCEIMSNDTYGDHSYLDFDNEGLSPGVMGIIVYHLLKQIPEYVVGGSMSWDGDESGDLGEIHVQDGKVYVCDGSIVYEEPNRDTQLYAEDTVTV